MSTISFGGLASGLDTDAIIKGLMEAERQPLERLEKTREYEETRLDAFRTYDSKLKNLNDSISGLFLSSGVRQSKVSLSSQQYVTAEATSASSGTYSVSVQQLAQVQKSATEEAYASRGEDVFGSGEIVFTVGGGEDAKEHTVAVEAGNGSLADIMNAINRNSHEHGISASIIDNGNEGGDRYHLMLTGADSDTTFTMDANLEGGQETLALRDTNLQEAQRAIAEVDGIEVTSRTNTLADAINGVTLHLEGVSPEDHATVMTVESDHGSVVEKMEEFVAAYNDIVNYVNGIDQGEEPEAGAGMLRGDSLASTVTRRLQGLMTSRVSDSGTFDALSQLGLSTNRNGTINFNTSVLENAMNEDFGQVVEVMAGDNGAFKDMRSYLNSTTSFRDGLLATREQSTEAVLKRIDSDIERTETRLERREEFLTRRFSAMEQMVSMFNSQSEYLTQQMDRMPKIGGK